MPLVSVIVPVFNKEGYLPVCLESIMAWGGYSECEVILIDDGSTDGSAVILDEFKHANPEVQVIHQKNSGVSAARNRGMALASGEYLTFVDADDEVVPGSLDKVLSYIKADRRTDIFITSAVLEGRNIEPSIFEDKAFYGDDASAAFTFVLTGGTEEKRIPGKATIFMTGCEKFYRREFLLENGIRFDEELARNEDVLFSCLCCSKADRIHFLPVTTYIIKEDPKGITKGMNIFRNVENQERFLDKFDACFETALNRQHLANFYFHQSLLFSYEMYRARKNGQLTSKQYRSMNKTWYGRKNSLFMLNNLNASRLSVFKRIAFFLMKLHMYRLVGIEMDVHHRHR